MKHDLVADDRGQILIATAVSMLAILGIGALAIDVGFMYDKRNRLYAVADAAAKSAAVELRRSSGLSCGGSCGWGSTLSLFVREQVTANGYTAVSCGSSGGVSTCVYSAPVSGTYTGNAAYVEVVLSEQTPTFFGKVLGWTSMTPGARAVAGSTSSRNCMVTLATTGDGFDVGNGTTLTMTDCIASVDANVKNQGTVNAYEIDAHACSTGCNPPNATPAVVYPVPYVRDPLETLNAPGDPGCPVDFNPCNIAKTIPGSTTTTLSPGKYGGWTFEKSATLQLSPGLYYLTGSIAGDQDVTINGTGVTVYLGTAAGLDLNKTGLRVNLSAQTTGPYKGILFYQDRGAPERNIVFGKNDASLVLSGAMYFPRSNFDLGKNNGAFTNDCTLFIAYRLTINNNGTFSNLCSAYGGSPIPTAALAE